MRVNKNQIDVSRAFLVFVTLCGDVQKTAAALDLDPKQVQALADQENWHEKISRISLLKKSEGKGDYEKAINRALNFAQAHRLRLLIDKMIERFDGMSPEEIADELSVMAKGGQRVVSSRFLSDLASAVEKAQHLSYIALGDTVGERQEATQEEGALTANQMHAAVIHALNNPSMQGVEAKLLEAEQAKALPIKSEVPSEALPLTQDERNSPARDAAEGGSMRENHA